ncbi:hypothetical protein [Burkholderia phage FLC9]|nr:hypothetical protein [Burkholderia phage FLC9]
MARPTNLAIIIQGNPKYLRQPKIRPLAEKFYGEIKSLLEEKGYVVEFDPGKPYTHPKIYAAVWVAHSRGIDRLRFARPSTKRIALQTKDHDQTFADNDERGTSPLHYELSDADRTAIAALPNVKQGN